MKATAISEFHHGCLMVTFVGLQSGINYRKLQGPRSKYCLDNGHGKCGCGFPVSRTKWELPDGAELRNTPRETGSPNSLDTDYGRGWIRIELV